MERSRTDLWTDRIIVGLLFAIAIAGPLLMGALRAQDFFWIQVLTVGAGMVAVIRLLFVPGLKVFVPTVFWCALAFTAYAIVRYANSDLEYVARKELLWVLTYLVIFALALNHLHDPRRVTALFVVLLVLGMGMSLFALRQHITGTNQVWHLIRPSYMFRGSGSFIYPNHFAGFLELVLPFAVASLFLAPFSAKAKLAIAYGAAWLLVGLYVSLSRAGWVGALIGFVVLLPLLLRNRRTQVWGFAAVVALLVTGLVWELKTGQIRKRFETFTGNNPTTDVSIRLSIWKAARKVWQAEPLFGAGPGHFDYRFRPYREPILQARPGRAHNDYLDLLANWGLAGAILVLLPLLLLCWPAAKEWITAFRNPDAAPTAQRLIIISGMAALSSIFVHALVDYQMHAPANAIVTLLIIAAVLAHLKGAEAPAWKTVITSRWPALVVLLGLLGVIAFEAQKSLREARLLNRAAIQSGPEKIQTLKAAFALEPNNFQTAYWIAECYRQWSWDGGDDYKQLAEDAIQWFTKASALNRFDPMSAMRLGTCLDWLKKHSEAEPYYQRALALDPNSYYIVGHYGWHLFQKGDYLRAKEFFVRSYALQPADNPLATTYLNLFHTGRVP